VVDYYNNRVQKFNSSGTWQLTVPSGCSNGSPPACTASSGNGNFNAPTGVAVDKSGNIWVVDNGNYRVEEFNSSGTYVKTIGGTGSCNSCASTSSCSCPQGASGGTLILPYGIGIDASGNVWVADSHTVQEFNSSGTYITQFGTYGVGGGGNLARASGVGFDSSGNVWVTDWDNNYVQEFSSSGTFIQGIGAGYNGAGGSIDGSGSGNGQFNSPTAIAVGR
jgi:secreted PhoX family phosphatase